MVSEQLSAFADGFHFALARGEALLICPAGDK